MVHVPIQHHHALCQPLGLCGLNGNGDIGEQAESVGIVRQAVMPRRAAQGIGVVEFPRRDRLHRCNCQPGRERGQFEPTLTERHAAPQLTPARVGQTFEFIEVRRRVDPR